MEENLNTFEHPRTPELDLRCGNQDSERGSDLAKITFGFTAEPGQELVSRTREMMLLCRGATTPGVL